ncbi:MAG: hypothetical protein A2Y79_11140 [Deltaproteobacteria bacterium RBG_13_43_22]|nr:MAG: hypothetical protein A2Y79_11140 [Deltaproteobacteria bacterium RBG_13_43_22]
MANWAEFALELERLLRLTTRPIAYKKFEKAAEMEKIPKLQKFDRAFNFCQLPSLVRRAGWTIGITRNNLGERCARLSGLAATTDEAKQREAETFARVSWFGTKEDALKQQADYPLIPPGEAVVLAPLQFVSFEPDVVLVYGNPAQMSLLMNGIQFTDYELLQFSFIGEGACTDSLAKCYVTGKPSLAIPCTGERRFGSVTDDELVIALPPGAVGHAVEGLKGLYARGLRYPIWFIGPECDQNTSLANPYR